MAKSGITTGLKYCKHKRILKIDMLKFSGLKYKYYRKNTNSRFSVLTLIKFEMVLRYFHRVVQLPHFSFVTLVHLIEIFIKSRE